MINPIDTVAGAQQRLEGIQASPIVGVCFLDGGNQLMQFFDDDADLKESILEYYRQRVARLIRSDRAHETVEILLTCTPADNCALPQGRTP